MSKPSSGVKLAALMTPKSKSPAGANSSGEQTPKSSKSRKSSRKKRQTPSKNDSKETAEERLKLKELTINTEELVKSNGMGSSSATVLKPTGMRRAFRAAYFCDSEGSVKRAYRKYSEPPEPKPLTICFQISECHQPSHQKILLAAKKHLIKCRCQPDDIESIQCVPTNVILGVKGMTDYWLITLKNINAMQQMFYGFTIGGKIMVVRRYDDIQSEEYKMSQRYATSRKLTKFL